MAEEPKEPAKSSSLVKTIIILGIVVLVAAIVAVVVFQFVVRPMLNPVEVVQEETPDDLIPPDSASIDFPEMQATVMTADPEEAAPVLIFQVSLLCKNAETSDLITERQSMFAAMISKHHRNRTRSELNDPYVQETLLRQVKQEANSLIKRLAPDADMEVLDALHLKYAIFDL